jgi:hypothetical protein
VIRDTILLAFGVVRGSGSSLFATGQAARRPLVRWARLVLLGQAASSPPRR